MRFGTPIDLTPEQLATLGASTAVAADVPPSAGVVDPVAPAVPDNLPQEALPSTPSVEFAPGVRLGAPITLTPDEIARYAQPAASGPQFGAPIDPLDDFDVFNAIEDQKEAPGYYDPKDPGIASKLWSGITDLVAMVPKAGKALLKVGNPQFGAMTPEGAALLSQTGGELLANYKMIGEGAGALANKTENAIKGAVYRAGGGSDPEMLAGLKTISRLASWKFQREARDVDQFTGKFNQNLELIFPEALKGLGAIPVDRGEAQALSVVSDPANFVPAATGARLATRWAIDAPLRGVVRAARSAARAASLEVAEAEARREALSAMLKPSLNPAERAPLFSQFSRASQALDAAKAKQAQANRSLRNAVQTQTARLDEIAQSPALVEQALAKGSQAAGRAADATGRVFESIAAIPDNVAARLAGSGDDVAKQRLAEMVRTGVNVVGWVPALVSGSTGAVLRGAGKNLRIYGQMLAEAESQLPFFKRLARETDGLTSWTASLVDQTGMGQFVVPASRAAADATRGVPFAAGLGFVGSGGDTDAALKGASTGLVFGLAGSSFGQWQSHLNGATFRQRQAGDVKRYRATLATDDVRRHFDQLPPADRTALATMQLAHPDLQIKHERLGKGRPSFYYAAEDGPVAVINLDSRDGIVPVVAHEIGHHVEKHGLGPVVERLLFGDSALQQPGLYSARDAKGAPVVGPDGRYQLAPEWQGLKDSYNARVQATAARTGEALPARNDADIAREVFAEHVADYLVGGNGSLVRDLRANVWTRALDGLMDSSLIGNQPMLQQVLGKLGVPLNRDRRVVGSGLFMAGLPSTPQMQRLIQRYHRASARNRQPGLSDERGDVVYTKAEVIKHPQIVEALFDGTDDLARDRLGRALRNPDGSPRFQKPAEQKAQRTALAKDIADWMEQKVPREGVDPATTRPVGAREERIVDEKTGRVVEEGWITPGLPEPLIAQLEASGKYNPTQIRHLREVSAAIRGGKGQSLLFFYQPALKNKKYQSLAGDWRTETPYALFVSKAGNVLFRSVSREKLVSNAQALVKRGAASPWDNRLPDLLADVDTYLANHAAGRPGDAGIGAEKRDIINALFGINTKQNRFKNPLIDMQPKTPGVVRARRIDRTNRMSPVEEFFPVDYNKVNQNLRPEAIVIGDERPPAL